MLTSPCWNTRYDEELWNNLDSPVDWLAEWEAFAKTGRELVWSYVTGIEKLANKYGCLFVDLFSPAEGLEVINEFYT